MSKAILLMDMPDCCGDCKIKHLNANNHGFMQWQCCYTDSPASAGSRADDCPLVEAIGYIQPVGHMVSWEDESDVD